MIFFIPVLLPGTVEPRCGLEVPGRHRDFGGQEEGQSRRLPQQKRHQGQGCCRRREGSCCTDQTNHRTDCSIWCRLISSSFFLEKYITLCEKRWACETNFLLGANLKASTLYRSRHKIPAWTLFVRPACPVDTFWSVPFQRVCPFGVYLSIWPGQG